jgi:alpha-L-rhamnosidase
MTLIPDLSVTGRWHAAWAWSAERGGPGLTVRRFRKTFDLDRVPQRFLVHVSADSRYRLYVNGRRAGRGPLKGTPERYHYETYDLSELLAPGTNVIAVEVFWFGLNAPNSEVHSGFAGFLLQGPDGAKLDTPDGWKVQIDRSVEADTTSYISNAQGFLDHCERVDGRLYPTGWWRADYDDSAWEPATLVCPADVNPAWGETHQIWDLFPRDVPALVEEPRRFAATLQDMQPVEHLFGVSPKGWSVPAGQAGEIVLDAGELTTGYLEVCFRGGCGRTVEIVYGEQYCRRDAEGRTHKQDKRDDWHGAVVEGYRDTLVLPGGRFEYEPFHWRTFWPVRIRISEGPEPVTMLDATYRFTTYPQTLRAEYESSDPDSQKMMQVSWHTLQLCSHETYEDCPYYEQLNYIFDSRNEALCSLAMAGETLLPKRTIQLFRDSIRPDGLVHARVPSRRKLRLPYFALAWVLMVDDYWLWTGDREFVRATLHAVEGVLGWFRDYLRDDGFLGKLPYWNPIGAGGAGGSALSTAAKEGGSTYLTSLFASAIDATVRLHEQAGYPGDAERWRPWAERIRESVRDKAWQEDEGLFAEAPELVGKPVSQHSQVQAILAGVATGEQMQRIMERLTTDDSIAPMPKPYAYYLARALEQGGRYEEFHRHVLEDYRRMLARNVTTWQEGGDPGRSDCHAWSSWPGVDFLTTVLGIQPRRPGFEEILIRPQPIYDFARGRMPTARGMVAVNWRREGTKVFLRADAPENVPVTVELPGVEPREFPAGGKIEIAP